LNKHTEKIMEEFPDIMNRVRCDPVTTRKDFVLKNQSLLNTTEEMMNLRGLPRHQIITTVNMYYHISRYIACGCKDYMVMPKLSVMLDETSIDTDYDFLKAPYHSLAIEPPPGFESIYNEDTGKHNVQVIYLTFDDLKDLKEIRFMIVGKPNTKKTHPLDDAFFYFVTKIKKDMSIESCLIDDIKRMESDAERMGENMKLMKKNISKSHRVFNYCINVLLYINSANADKAWRNVYPHHVENRMQKLKDKKRIKRLKKINKSMKKCVLGENIVRSYTSKTSESKWSLSKRIHVSGHYHKYWYGSGKNKVLKPKWIEPYWKGPETADKVHTKIQVGKE